MMYATKSNIQIKIDDDQADVYAKQGYTIMDKDGVIVPCSHHAPVPYEEHIKVVGELEAKIQELEAKLQSGETDDFQ